MDEGPGFFTMFWSGVLGCLLVFLWVIDHGGHACFLPCEVGESGGWSGPTQSKDCLSLLLACSSHHTLPCEDAGNPLGLPSLQRNPLPNLQVTVWRLRLGDRCVSPRVTQVISDRTRTKFQVSGSPPSMLIGGSSQNVEERKWSPEPGPNLPSGSNHTYLLRSYCVPNCARPCEGCREEQFTNPDLREMSVIMT